jgi:hypothetical protein
MTRTTLVLALALAALGCNKKPAGDKAAPGDKPAAGAMAADKPAAAALAFKKLGSLPLEAEVPADANIDDTSKGAGYPSVSIYASPTTFVSGAGDMSDLKPTIEATKAQLGKDPNKLKAFTREEKTADGWILELTREAMVEPGKELFGVSVRRTLGGAPWDCGTNAASKDEQAKAEKLCLSLRPAK